MTRFSVEPGLISVGLTDSRQPVRSSAEQRKSMWSLTLSFWEGRQCLCCGNEIVKDCPACGVGNLNREGVKSVHWNTGFTRSHKSSSADHLIGSLFIIFLRLKQNADAMTNDRISL
jgi:hypothetical protein